jgi:beta-phosphoglucomutase
LSKIEVVIVDLDGTLLDSELAVSEAYASSLLEEGLDISDQDYRKIIPGRHYSQFLPLLAPQVPSDRYPFILKRKNEIYFQKMPGLTLNHGLIGLLKAMKMQGVHISLCTSASKEAVDFFLKTFDLRNLFEITVTGSDVTTRKPNPEGFIKIQSFFKCATSNVLVFEDSDTGVKAAVAANMPYIRVSF